MYDEFVQHLDDHLTKGVTPCTPYIFAMKADPTFPMSLEQFEKLRIHDAAGMMCVHLAGTLTNQS